MVEGMWDSCADLEVRSWDQDLTCQGAHTYWLRQRTTPSPTMCVPSSGFPRRHRLSYRGCLLGLRLPGKGATRLRRPQATSGTFLMAALCSQSPHWCWPQWPTLASLGALWPPHSQAAWPSQRGDPTGAVSALGARIASAPHSWYLRHLHTQALTEPQEPFIGYRAQVEGL